MFIKINDRYTLNSLHITHIEEVSDNEAVVHTERKWFVVNRLQFCRISEVLTKHYANINKFTFVELLEMTNTTLTQENYGKVKEGLSKLYRDTYGKEPERGFYPGEFFPGALKFLHKQEKS